jgi:rubrerythrin
MSELNTAAEILDYAIGMEQKAIDLYTDLAAKASNEVTRKVFAGFAGEERGHKSKLEAVKAGHKPLVGAGEVLDLRIADYTNDIVLGDQPTYEEALLFAMKQEKQAFRMYSDLAERTDAPELRELFLVLAQEEAKHKLRFEVEYDEHVLTEN